MRSSTDVSAHERFQEKASQQQGASRSKNRWGLLTKQAETIAGLISDMERKSNEELQWNDFDHEYTMELGSSDTEPDSTLLVFEKEDTDKSLVLRSCPPADFEPDRKQLVELARTSDSFLATKCVFNHNGRVYVGSGYSDISLAEIIEGPFELKEKHVALVASCLLDLQECGLIYGSIRAQNVFVGRNGKVQLAAFGKDVSPIPASTADHKSLQMDRWGVGCLAVHMITRSPDEPENVIWQQKMLSVGGASGLCLDAKFEPSPDFVDFLLLCFADKGDMRRVSKHPFLWKASSCSLNPFLLAAERLVLRNCYPLAMVPGASETPSGA
ncbi:hypothetical protein NA56DRAFT_702467 [Hyaloscypha hepaticicola]|uniref:Protein kinase domain-containing protein n=1 Tax=Hyaloscypha hepaticicola TaxID=2082293 RepID=A0A2J6Q8S4_9HELO|nr:hypothetical protein NA56DRAFT_702467 [Hyaloscypha hepaticicola]